LLSFLIRGNRTDDLANGMGEPVEDEPNERIEKEQNDKGENEHPKFKVLTEILNLVVGERSADKPLPTFELKGLSTVCKASAESIRSCDHIPHPILSSLSNFTVFGMVIGLKLIAKKATHMRIKNNKALSVDQTNAKKRIILLLLQYVDQLIHARRLFQLILQFGGAFNERILHKI